MNGSRSSEPPEEPFLRSEPSLLSPASPKPFHFPQPTNIPILEMQMDVDFNQTEVHMSDRSTRNTGIRPDAWREPNEQAAEATSSFLSNDKDPITNSITTALDDHANPELGATLSVAENARVPLNENGALPLTGPDVDAVKSSNAKTDAFSNVQPIAKYQSSDFAKSALVSDSYTLPPQTPSTVEQSQQPTANAVDVRALLDNLEHSLTSQNATADRSATVDSLGIAIAPAQSEPVAYDSVENASASGPGTGAQPSGLPPRPPPQEQPNIHPNYLHSQHIRDYHPHAANLAFQLHVRNNSTGNMADSNAPNFVPPVTVPATQQETPSGQGNSNELSSQAAVTADSSISQHVSASLPQTPAAAEASAPIESRRELKLAAGETPSLDDVPWTPETQRKYDRFLDEERKYVNEARWDQFPTGSRLFVGNLSSEKVTKRDIFHVFHPYGELAQISIKQAYGFVQFLKMEDCSAALAGQQGRQIRDKRIHLEVSKPQKSKGAQQNTSRRSRSPDHGRRQGGNVDRYTSGRGPVGRGRDEYRGYRSPSPRGYRDRYDDRNRARSRSPGYGRDDRYRARSPRDEDDDLPLPRRSPRDVPDVQIIIQTELNRDFITWIEGHFTAVGVRVGTLRLAPRLSEVAVVRRQILEGVVAVIKLQRSNQETSKIGLKIFKRQAGNRDVQFLDYDNLDPTICAQLVLREKQSPPTSGDYATSQYNAPAPMPQYGYQPPSGPPLPPTHQNSYNYIPVYATSAPAPASTYGAPQPPPNISTNNLQNLLASLNQGSPNTPQNTTSGHQYGAQQPPSSTPAGYPAPPSSAYGQYLGSVQAPPPPNVYTTFSHQIPSQPSQTSQTPNMQEILARLGTYGKR